jgi:raffinose/stachyose/melibiose transport system permease protein
VDREQREKPDGRILALNHKKRSLYPAYLTLPSLLIFGVFFAVPVIASFVLSFSDWNLNRFDTPKINGFANFVYLFTDKYFILSLNNTVVFALAVVILKTGFGFLGALLLVKKFPLRNIMRTIFVLPSVLSMVIIGILFISIFRMDGMINHMLRFIGLESLTIDWLGNRKTALYIAILADVWRWSGFCMAVFVAGMQGISQDYYEAARIDGANWFQVLKKVTIPLLVPAFSVNITFNLIGGLKVFEQVFVVTKGGPGYASQVLGTYLFTMFSRGLLGRSTAMGLVLFVLVLAVSQTVQYFINKAEVDY